MADFQVGDKVTWHSSGGKSIGKVTEVLTKPIEIKNQSIQASPDDVRYLVESDDTGAVAAHKASALTKL